LTGEEILYFQQLVRKIPISDNVLEYAVSLTGKTRPGTERSTDNVDKYISWGAGPRASQFLRHRIVRNYKAEAEGITEEHVIEALF